MLSLNGWAHTQNYFWVQLLDIQYTTTGMDNLQIIYDIQPMEQKTLICTINISEITSACQQTLPIDPTLSAYMKQCISPCFYRHAPGLLLIAINYLSPICSCQLLGRLPGICKWKSFNQRCCTNMVNSHHDVVNFLKTKLTIDILEFTHAGKILHVMCDFRFWLRFYFCIYVAVCSIMSTLDHVIMTLDYTTIK